MHMFVGEFSAIRIAPTGSAVRYLEDVTSLFEEFGFDWTYHAYREWQGWSLAHVGPLNNPRRANAPTPTPRAQVILGWMQHNRRAAFRPGTP